MEVGRKEQKVFSDNFDPTSVDKKLPSQYYAPPTIEELQELRETEHLFRSNLIRLQLDELLKEVQIPERVQKNANEFLAKLKSLLFQTKERAPSTEVSSNSSFLPSLSLSSADNVVASFTFVPPLSVELIGSYHDQSILWYGNEVTVDLCVTMPKRIFWKSDYLNMRYFIKRAIYAEETMNQLKELFGGDPHVEFKLCVEDNDFRRPYLLVFQKGEDQFRVRILFIPERDTFTSSRFSANKSCLRNKWYSGSSEEEGNLISSPLTNQSILADITCHELSSEIHKHISFSPNFVSGLKLIKVWLKQHHLSSVSAGFTNFMAKALLAILIGKKKVCAQMSHYQIFRCVISYLASVDKISTSFDEHPPQEGGNDYPAVILWKDYNICSNLTHDLFAMVQSEAKRSIDLLGKESGFQQVFIDSIQPSLYFDSFMSIDTSQLDREDAADCCNLTYVKSYRLLSGLLRKALTDRMQLIVNLSPFCKEWEVSDGQPNVPQTLRFGVLYSERFSRTVDRSADPDQDEEFSKFWSPLSQARKFNDGSVVEAVVWSCSSEVERHHVWTRMVDFALKKHFSDKILIHYASAQLDGFVTYPSELVNDMLQRNRRSTEAINEICETLHGIEELPLSIASVWPELCTSFRASEPSKEEVSIPILCKLELSRRWPSHTSAVRRLTLAYCIRLCRFLRQRNLRCTISFWEGQRTVLLSYKGYTFRLFVTTDAEIRVCRQEGKLSTPKQWEQLHVCSWLAGVQFDHPMWPYAVCLCKRWMSGNFLLTFWTEMTVEVLCAYIFTKPEPLPSPRSLILAFKRFLSLLGKHNWFEEPLLVKADSINGDDLSSFLQRFKSDRNKYPPATIVTSGPDSDCPMIVLPSPSALLVKRTIQLAERCLAELEPDKLLMNDSNLKKMFSGSMGMCDVRIMVEKIKKPTDKNRYFGYVDFNPVELFLRSLKDSYGQFAIFLYDQYGGNEIGVVWRKNNLEPRPLTVQSASAGGGQLTSRKRTVTNRLVTYDPLQFIEQWKILGLGIVKAIHGKSK